MLNHERAAIVLGILALLVGLPALPAAQADELCATTTDGAPAAGVVNTYYDAGPSTATLVPGTIDIPVGAVVGTPAIGDGDLLLIMQMQGATINSNDSDSYGDGNPGDPASGMLATPAPLAGHYEYVVARGPVAGGLVPVEGKGPTLLGNPRPGILNTYVNEAATASEGRKGYQVVRVPRYASLLVPSGGLRAEYWNGSAGGILVFDVIGALDMNSQTLSASERGFRGGMGQNLGGTPGATASNYRYSSLPGFSVIGSHGNKGEGIAGTPRYLRDSFTGADIETGAEGYPNGSRARGAPANAGGGGTDSNPGSNNDSAGGGGGGNGGPGGRGGNTDSNQPTGGHGGARFEAEPSFGSPAVPLWGPGRVVMGGGGGSGSKHDASPDESGGGAGGGIVLIRTGSVAPSTGTIAVNGLDSLATGNDGGGGAGAGGSVIFVSKNTNYTGVTLAINANGGRGSDAGSGSSVLGPGGGGGGGVVIMNAYTNGGGITVTSAQGANGLTQSGTLPHGSTSGTLGTVPGDPSNPFINWVDIPGADAGADCDGNGAPVNTVPGAQQTLINTARDFSTANGNVVSTWDPDSDLTDVQVTLTVTDGTLTLNAGAFAALTSVAGNGTATVDLFGTWAEINAAMNPMTYTPTALFSGPVTFQIVTNDLGNTGVGGPMSDTDTVLITVDDQNLAPWANVPGAQTTPEDTALVFSFDTLNRISVQDSDAGTNPIQVTLTVSDGIVATVDDGALTLASTTGITVVAGANGSSTMTITGTLANLEAALGANATMTPGLSYLPPLNFTGTVTLTVTVDDLGWSGPGGFQDPLPGLTDTENVAITVTPLNDPPVAVPDSYQVGRSLTLAVAGAGVLGNDTDVEGSTLTAVLDSGPATGSFALIADGTFTYSAPAGFVGTVTFTYHANDGTADSNVATVTIVVFDRQPGQRAGYCGLTGLEAFAALALLGLFRRRSRNR